MAILRIKKIDITTVAIVVCTLFLCCFSLSCSVWSEAEDDWIEASELPAGHNIAIMAGSSAATRTQIDPSDMQSVMWSDEDRIALWAMADGSSSFSCAAIPLSLYYYGKEYNTAVFTGNVPVLPDDSYTYFATYPLPKASSGSSVTLSLPSTQSGYYDGEADLMYARLEEHGPLGGDALKNGSMVFRQLTHAIRIEVPKERDLLGATSKLQIIFPESVVGDVTLNLTDQNPALSLSKGSNSIYVDFDKVISESGYVWLFIAPTTINGDIEFVGYDKDNVPSKLISKSIYNRDMAAGRITPITLTIPEEGPRKVVVSISKNNLGEPMKSMTLSAPEGAYFEGGLSRITVPANAEGKFEFSYSARLYDKIFRMGDILVSFESEHAIVPCEPIRLSSDDKYLVNHRDYVMPYLFEEDFSGVSGSDHYKGLDSQALPGMTDCWIAGRTYHYWDSKCVALTSFYLWGVTYYAYLSLDLDGQTYLKPNATVTLAIECNAEWRKKNNASMKLMLYDNDNDKNSVSVSLANKSDASENNIPTKRHLELPNCKSNTVIVWQTDQGKASGWGGSYDYLFIDNIKISIK